MPSIKQKGSYKMRRLTNSLAVAALAAVFSLTGASAAQAGVLAWDCPAGYSCYYDNKEGGNRIWIAPSAGCFDLGRMNPPLNDRISSVNNGGNGQVHLYNWEGHWAYLENISRGAKWNTRYQNVADMVCIDQR